MVSRKARSNLFYKQAIQVLRHGYTDPETNRRQGKFADGFDVADGYDLRKINDWSPAQKAKVTRMFKVVDKLTSRPYQVYKSRDPRRLKQVQKAAQHDEFPRGLKVAFVPTSAQAERVKVKVSKTGKVKFKQGSIAREIIDFENYGYSPEQLAIDPVGVIRDVTTRAPANRYKIQAGEHEVNQGSSIRGMGSSWTADKLPIAISKMINQYSADRFDPEDKNSSYYGNWLFGVVAYNFDEYTNYQNYQAAYNRARQVSKDRRAALRAQAKRRIDKEKAARQAKRKR